MNCKVALVFFAGLVFNFKVALAQKPTSEKRVWIYSKSLTIDPKVWSFYAPGSLKPRATLPLNENDGVMIKYANDEKKRDLILIHAEPLVSDLSKVCASFDSKSRKGQLDKKKKECLVTEIAGGKMRLLQWIYQDIRALKQISLVFSYHEKRSSSAFDDLKMIQKGMGR